MCLHVTAAIHCNLGQYGDAIPILEHSIEIPVIEEGQDHALAKFAGYMQLGDTYAMLGQVENSIICYTTGLGIQRQVLGDNDPRVGETCRYLAEAHVQALQFDEAEKLCQMALDMHRDNGSPPSLEEAADRRLMGLICESKGDHEAALEHLVLASMAMVANGQEAEVASVDCSIGDTYLSLNRYDEAIFAYQKALTALKSGKGESHPSVASVFVRLADLYNRTEEIASGLTDVSAIYESMNELEQALKLLQKALKIYNDAPGQQSTIAGIEAQMGVIYYMLGRYSDSYNSFKSGISKLRASGEKKSAFFGIALNQMGLACIQRYAINEAVDLFEEARGILEQEYGPYHPETLGVYSNLAGTYDAVGRLEDAIEILEFIVNVREEKLGTANPDVDDEKKRLAELLKEAGRVRNRKARSLENLLDVNHRPNSTVNNNGIKRIVKELSEIGGMDGFIQEHKRPKKSRSLDDAAVKVSAEEYEYEIFLSPEEYQKANLEPPRYDLPQKYTPQRAAVTVAVRPPLPEAGSRGTMRSFPVSARPPAPAKKISLGSKKAGPARPTDPSAEALVPAGLPLTATHPSNLSGDHGETRAAKHGRRKRPKSRRSHRRNALAVMGSAPQPSSGEDERVVDRFGRGTHRLRLDPVLQMAHSVTDLFARAKDGDEIHRREVAPLKKSLAKRDQRIKELEGKLKTAEETGRRILERADLGEKILTDPVLLAGHICRGQETGEAVLAAISRTPVGEDLMYEFGTWAFNSRRRAMQNDVKTALEVAMDEADLPNILAVLPEEVPDPGVYQPRLEVLPEEALLERRQRLGKSRHLF
nr:protein KINESIN LIGHT CHAIN-RELATED 3-like [Ipomoea batatas]